jgi:hypothetical protein
MDEAMYIDVILLKKASVREINYHLIRQLPINDGFDLRGRSQDFMPQALIASQPKDI